MPLLELLNKVVGKRLVFGNQVMRSTVRIVAVQEVIESIQCLGEMINFSFYAIRYISQWVELDHRFINWRGLLSSGALLTRRIVSVV